MIWDLEPLIALSRSDEAGGTRKKHAGSRSSGIAGCRIQDFNSISGRCGFGH